MAGRFQGMGAVLDTAHDECGFRVWAPHASAAWVTGDFCGWKRRQIPLAREGDGYWAAAVPKVRAGAQYKFEFRNGKWELWRVDPYAHAVVADAKGNLNGVVVDRTAHWSPFATPRFDDLILYQLHVGSFAGCDDGIPVRSCGGQVSVATCSQMVCKLDYIRGLGFNALALLPFGELHRPSRRTHMGYAPSHYFSLGIDYGKPEDYRGDGLRFDSAHLVQRESLKHILYLLRQNPYWRDKYMIAEWSGISPAIGGPRSTPIPSTASTACDGPRSAIPSVRPCNGS